MQRVLATVQQADGRKNLPPSSAFLFLGYEFIYNQELFYFLFPLLQQRLGMDQYQRICLSPCNHSNSGGWLYGPVQIRFKKENLLPRTTFTVEDSLGMDYQPSLVSAPRASSFDSLDASRLPYFLSDNPRVLESVPELMGKMSSMDNNGGGASKLGAGEYNSDKTGRAATKIGLRYYENDTSLVSLSKLQDEQIRRLSNKYGINSRKMTFIEADEGKANIDKNKGRPFEDNCQSAVVVHEARLRGLDITSLGFDKTRNSWSTRISANTCLAWVDENGKTPHPKECSDSPSNMRSWLMKTTKSVGRYHIGIDERSGRGHIITAEKRRDGLLLLYDAQKGLFYNIADFLSQADKIEVLRVDNLLFNEEALSAISRAL